MLSESETQISAYFFLGNFSQVLIISTKQKEVNSFGRFPSTQSRSVTHWGGHRLCNGQEKLGFRPMKAWRMNEGSLFNVPWCMR